MIFLQKRLTFRAYCGIIIKMKKYCGGIIMSRKIKNFGIQLWTVRDLIHTEEGIDDTFGKLAEMGYEELHTVGIPTTAERYYELAAKHGLRICGTHWSWDDMMKDPEKVMADHKAMHTTNIGIGGMPGDYAQSPEKLREFCETVNKFAEKVNKYGFKFTYHNHAWEFAKLEGKRVYDYLVEGFDPKTTSFCFDTYWAQAAGCDPIQWIRKLEGRLDILHLKDMKFMDDDKEQGPRICEIGQGNMNFDGIVDAALDTGVKNFIVEQDYCPGDPLASAKISADYIKEHYM